MPSSHMYTTPTTTTTELYKSGHINCDCKFIEVKLPYILCERERSK